MRARSMAVPTATNPRHARPIRNDFRFIEVTLIRRRLRHGDDEKLSNRRTSDRRGFVVIGSRFLNDNRANPSSYPCDGKTVRRASRQLPALNGSRPRQSIADGDAWI